MPAGNHGDERGRDSKPLRQFNIRALRRKAANQSHLSVGNLFYWVKALATLGDHIAGVVPVGPKPEVLRRDAERNVAAVAHKSAVWDWAFVNHEGRSMSQVGHPAVFDLSVLPVALSGIKDASVFLNRTAHIEAHAKRFQKRRDLGERLCQASRRTVFRALEIGWGRRLRELAAAIFTNDYSCRHEAIVTHNNGGLNAA